MMIKTRMDPGPWTGAPDSLWRNNDLNHRRFLKREAICQTQARQEKLSNTIQTGRVYGLGQELYETIRQKKLEARLGPGLTSPRW